LVFVLLTFLWTWNSFLIPLVLLAGSNISTATMTMAGFQGAHVTDIPGLAAAALFVSMPVIVVYALTQRHFIRGFTEGSLKM
jgi:raffinose/stachyose/melibiose transport system permease protein